MRTTAFDERWVDVFTYESCGHQYWQEKGLNLEEGICDSCLDHYINEKFKKHAWTAKMIWDFWNNKKVRRFIRG